MFYKINKSVMAFKKYFFKCFFFVVDVCSAHRVPCHWLATSSRCRPPFTQILLGQALVYCIQILHLYNFHSPPSLRQKKRKKIVTLLFALLSQLTLQLLRKITLHQYYPRKKKQSRNTVKLASIQSGRGMLMLFLSFGVSLAKFLTTSQLSIPSGFLHSRNPRRGISWRCSIEKVLKAPAGMWPLLALTLTK